MNVFARLLSLFRHNHAPDKFEPYYYPPRQSRDVTHALELIGEYQCVPQATSVDKATNDPSAHTAHVTEIGDYDKALQLDTDLYVSEPRPADEDEYRAERDRDEGSSELEGLLDDPSDDRSFSSGGGGFGGGGATGDF